MSDTVADVIVIGNRRPAGSKQPFGGGRVGGGSSAGGPNMLTLPDDPNAEGGGPPPDCSPRRKHEKNIDAAAAEAAAEFARMGNAAGEDGINDRERGAYLFLNGDRSVSIGPISEGPLFVSGGVGTTGQLQLGGRSASSIIGSVHSHGIGNSLPSTGPNGTGDREHLQDLVEYAEENGGIYGQRIYIVAQTLVGAGETPYNAIHVFFPETIDAEIAANAPSTEVDPLGQPCP